MKSLAEKIEVSAPVKQLAKIVDGIIICEEALLSLINDYEALSPDDPLLLWFDNFTDCVADKMVEARKAAFPIREES